MRVPSSLVSAILIASLSACSGSDEAPTCDDPVATTSVDMTDFDYAPGCIEVENGQTLTVSNSGDVLHTFTVPDTDMDLSVEPASSGELAIDGLTRGVYRVICELHGNMTAALSVR